MLCEISAELIKLETQIKALKLEHNDSPKVASDTASKYLALAERQKEISKDMKDKKPEQYKKLTARIFETNKKSETFQSVKIKKALIEELKTSRSQWQDIPVEHMVQSALEHFINPKKLILERISKKQR